ncbi:Uncharacterised protein [Campylobacter hyointestinalis subsp. hyointestinalis]|uniref:Uncharacterized protein n=1 Tax=Campylobacter hyointestinalis subsp. hyointestinalis TaxID=91352 RepID=A0A0S4SF71_CAMHY|nr:hypothetical protein [Campylobacter hyointestinalis]CUU83530.1 Uncharacterised protein [Campylobacter hyointestinalis subsp. hyointestinalis]CUU84561.1 Uncharacterised protein [Campylobacter hyointestinalis subsp. hyointestinalis]CUU88634.1 Uncharacterised protein [Campylobacter hyointestinalis subsp. hyointestinalis]
MPTVEVDVDIDIQDYIELDDVIKFLKDNESCFSSTDFANIFEALGLAGAYIPKDKIREHCFEMSDEEAMEYIKWIEHYHALSQVS